MPCPRVFAGCGAGPGGKRPRPERSQFPRWPSAKCAWASSSLLLPRCHFLIPCRASRSNVLCAELCMSVSGVRLWEADSFDVFDFVVSCEERFNIGIPNDAATKFGACDANGGRYTHRWEGDVTHSSLADGSRRRGVERRPLGGDVGANHRTTRSVRLDRARQPDVRGRRLVDRAHGLTVARPAPMAET
jgi:hypothetical protein